MPFSSPLAREASTAGPSAASSTHHPAVVFPQAVPNPPQGHEDHLVSALHAAFHSLSLSSQTPQLSSSSTSTHSVAPEDMIISSSFGRDKEKDRSHTANIALDIQVASDQLYLKGTGVDVEPALLTGNVVLTLAEATSIKQITLLFRGKARVPPNPNDPHVLNYSPSQYIVCNHEWTFLEGEKKHSHTLKAGRHLFPFELRLGGSLPSSIATPVNGGASVSYKLRAVAIRPGFSANLSTTIPVSVLRTFAPESLEYQQTLEIENTWPDKLMYSLMIPHKAWAAGDELTSLVKFVPMTKGVRVLTVTTNIAETTKTLTKGGHLERTRNVVSRKHEITHGRAVSCDDNNQRRRLQTMLQYSLGGDNNIISPHSARHHLFSSSGMHSTSNSQVHSGSSSPGCFVSGISTPVVEGASGLTLTRPGSHDSSESNASAASSSSSPAAQNAHDASLALTEPIDEDNESSEISTTISVTLPRTLTPSHSLDPIIVSYRIRWSILIGNADGHTSELRCSLPVHILDYSLMDEARSATSATRRLIFGASEDAEGEEEVQLPSYSAHVRDRVAVVDVGGMGMGQGAVQEAQVLRPLVHDASESGTNTPMEYGLNDFPVFTHVLPTNPMSHSSDGVIPPFSITPPRHGEMEMSSSGDTMTTASSTTTDTSRPGSRHSGENGVGSRLWNRASRSSRVASRANSRVQSRATSPDRSDGSSHHGHGQGHYSLEPVVSSPDEIHFHANNPAMRQQHGVFSAMMKPLTGLASHWSHSHSHHGTTIPHPHPTATTHRPTGERSMTFPSPPLSFSISHYPSVDGEDVGAPVTSSVRSSLDVSARNSSYSTVPDYFTASQNASGLPPLETLRDLPTYDDSEAQALDASRRSFSDTDLMSHFSRSRTAVPTPLTQRVQ